MEGDGGSAQSASRARLDVHLDCTLAPGEPSMTPNLNHDDKSKKKAPTIASQIVASQMPTSLASKPHPLCDVRLVPLVNSITTLDNDGVEDNMLEKKTLKTVDVHDNRISNKHVQTKMDIGECLNADKTLSKVKILALMKEKELFIDCPPRLTERIIWQVVWEEIGIEKKKILSTLMMSYASMWEHDMELQKDG